ncbi:MAG: hemolysin III family protein [Actinomycetota bacterium]|nr:hemolysin III family protein [Actinomycetota bacterium]
MAFTPLLRGELHRAALWVAIPAAVALVIHADGPAAVLGATVFGTALVGLLTTSAVYHTVVTTPATRLWARRADHAAIFVFIGATYLPVCLLALPRTIGLPLLAFISLGAAIGAGAKLSCLQLGVRRVSWLYTALGATAVVSLPWLELDPFRLGLMVGGGLVYGAGGLALLTNRPNPHPPVFGYHEVWHAATIVAMTAHFLVIWSIT